MKLPAIRFTSFASQAADQDAVRRDTGSACEISTVSVAPPRRFAYGYEEEREETLTLQQHRYRCRADLRE
jgi:hypothetical protein